MIKRTKLKIEPLKSLCWAGNTIIDWASGGNRFNIATGEKEDASFFLAYNFDSAIMSKDGQYVIVYQKLGTKGLIFKNSELIREINRSYYHAHVYEYPIEIRKLKNGKTIIIHCPNEYCQLEIEEIETGEKIGFKPERKTLDFFHSRLGSSEDYLISVGWAWHPYDSILIFDFEKALSDITVLDGSGIEVLFGHQITSSRFISESRIIVSTSTEEPEDFEGDLMRPCSIGIYDIKESELLKQMKLNFSFGNVIPIDLDYALDIFDYPKVINLNTGIIEEQYENLKTGRQNSSIIYHLEELPKLAISRDYRNIAIQVKDGIEILEVECST